MAVVVSLTRFWDGCAIPRVDFYGQEIVGARELRKLRNCLHIGSGKRLGLLA